MAPTVVTRAPSWLLVVAFNSILLGSPCYGESVVLTDDFSTGIQGWTYAVEPGAVMNWDPIEGNPDPGSLALSTIGQSTRLEGYWVLGPCMDSFPNETWLTESMLRKTGSVFGHCRAFVSLFASLDCSGEGTVTGSAGGVPPIAPDVWHSDQWSSPPLPSTQSARPVLFMSVSAETAISCHFDSVVVSRSLGADAADVPALSAVGLVVMASVLVALAVAVLARRRVERARPRR